MPVNDSVVIICICDGIVHSASAIHRTNILILGNVGIRTVRSQNMHRSAHVRIGRGSTIVLTVVYCNGEIAGHGTALIHISELVILDNRIVTVIVVCIAGIVVFCGCSAIECTFDVFVFCRDHNRTGLVDQPVHFTALETVNHFGTISVEGINGSKRWRKNDIAGCIFQSVLSIFVVRNNLIICSGHFVIDILQRFRSLHRRPCGIVCGDAAV